jgi:protease I
MSRKVLIVTGDGGDSFESLYACHRFMEAGWEPFVAAPARRKLHLVTHDFDPGWETYVERPGHVIEADMAITAVSAKEFAALIFPGGRAPEYLRNNTSLLSLVREFAHQEKCICAIGHGIQILAAADDFLRGRSVTCHPYVRIEIDHAGAHYVDKPAVRDGKLITAQTWKAHPEFYREVFAVLV